MFIRPAFILMATSTVILAQQRTALGPVSVKTDYGEMIFRNISLYRDGKAWFSASLENNTGTAWHVVEFKVSYACGAERVAYGVIIPTINPGTSSVSDKPIGGPGACDASAIEISYRSGRSDRADEERLAATLAEQRAIEAEATAQRERAAMAERAAEKKERDRQAKATAIRRAAEQRETDRLSRLPTLFSDTTAIFVGSDRKCAQQYAEALRMDGLEKRKRLADLISFGCGFIAKPGVHIAIRESGTDYLRVMIEEGEEVGRSGWVASSWIVPPGRR